MVWNASLLYKLNAYGISGRVFDLILSFLDKRLPRVVLDGKSSQEYPINAGVLLGSILGHTLFLLHINQFPGNAIHNIAMYADDTTLYFKYH